MADSGETGSEQELIVKKAKLGATEIKNVKQSLSASNLVPKVTMTKSNTLRKSLSATKLPLASVALGSPSPKLKRLQQQQDKENEADLKDGADEKDKDGYSITLSSSALSVSSTSSAGDNKSEESDDPEDDEEMEEEENEDDELRQSKDDDGDKAATNKITTETEKDTKTTETDATKNDTETKEVTKTVTQPDSPEKEENHEEGPQKEKDISNKTEEKKQEESEKPASVDKSQDEALKASVTSERRTRTRSSSKKERKDKDRERELKSSRELRSPRRTLSASQWSQFNPFFSSMAMAPQYYSQAARLFVSQFPFQPHHANVVDEPVFSNFLQGGTYMADFAISPAYAIEAYKDWKQSLWFAPESFLGTLDPLALTPLFLPCFAFSLFTHTTHHGKAGYIKPEAGQFRFEFQWAEGKKSTFTQTQFHPEALAYAPVVKGEKAAVAPPYELMKEVWYWKLERLRQQTEAETKGLPHKLYFHQTKQFEVNVVPPSTALDAWKYAQRRLRRNEQYIADLKFKRELKCDIASDVQTETRFSHILVKLVYLPVYLWTHQFEGAKYYTLMNGQNGLIHGTRPYRLKGSLDSALKVLTGGYMSNNNCQVIKGADLAIKDGFGVQNTPYEPHLSYIVFPSSDQLLVFIAIGWLRVRNTSSSDPVVIAAQKRLNPRMGKKLLLEPGSEHIISYRGAWTFCVTKGDAHSVVIAHVSTNSGSEKNNIMGMC